jgi:hypothetical protein
MDCLAMPNIYYKKEYKVITAGKTLIVQNQKRSGEGF